MADLIDLLRDLRRRPRPEEGAPTGVKEDFYRVEVELESHIQTALLAYGGPAVWRGELWWTHERPRAGVVNNCPVYNAAALPWPVQTQTPTPTPINPDELTNIEIPAGTGGKEAGFVSEHEMER